MCGTIGATRRWRSFIPTILYSALYFTITLRLFLILVKKPVIMKDVAVAAGVSLMTVSYALRHHSSIPESTRRRIFKIAEDLGYTKSPLVSALMAHLRSQREVKNTPLIAYVCGYSDHRTMLANSFRRAYFEGAVARAESQGYRLELFFINDYSSRGGRRLSEVMRYRNVQGVIMGISPLNTAPVQLEWSAFASCVMGYSKNYKDLHNIDANSAQMLSLTLQRLKEKGYRRIGSLCGAFEDRRVEGVIKAAMAGYNHNRRVSERVPFEILPPHRWNAKYISHWTKQQALDSLIIQSHSPFHFLVGAGRKIPKELAVVTLERSTETILSGIDQRPRQVGAAAVDLIIYQLNQNLRGIPANRRTLLLDGAWIDGSTAPGC